MDSVCVGPSKSKQAVLFFRVRIRSPTLFLDWKWVGGRQKLYEEYINQGFFDVCNVGDVCTLHEVKTMA